MTDSVNDPMMNEIELNAKSTNNIMENSTASSDPLGKKSKCKSVSNTLVSLLCGYELEIEGDMDRMAAESSLQQKDEAKRRFESFRSLNQTRWEKCILNFNLVLILCISIGLYVFFSIPPQQHIFKYIQLNSTSMSFNQTSLE